MSHNGSNPVLAKLLYYFQFLMVMVYFGIGLLLLFSPFVDAFNEKCHDIGFALYIRPEAAKLMSAVFLAYGAFRTYTLWKKRKETHNNDH